MAMSNLATLEAAMFRAKKKFERATELKKRRLHAFHDAVSKYAVAKDEHRTAVDAFEQAAHAAKQSGE